MADWPEFAALAFAHADLATRIGEALCSPVVGMERSRVIALLNEHVAELRERASTDPSQISDALADYVDQLTFLRLERG